jgi:hypothetical protein
MARGHIFVEGREIAVESKSVRHFLQVLWFDAEILALATSLALQIVLLRNQLRFRKKRVHVVVLWTSLRVHTRVFF